MNLRLPVTKSHDYFMVLNVLKGMQKQITEEYSKKLLHRRYSTNTQKTYLSLFKKFVLFFKSRQIDEITKPEIEEYIYFLIQSKDISFSTQNQIVNAIKFYYEHVLKRERLTYWIDRTRVVRTLLFKDDPDLHSNF